MLSSADVMGRAGGAVGRADLDVCIDEPCEYYEIGGWKFRTPASWLAEIGAISVVMWGASNRVSVASAHPSI